MSPVGASAMPNAFARNAARLRARAHSDRTGERVGGSDRMRRRRSRRGGADQTIHPRRAGLTQVTRDPGSFLGGEIVLRDPLSIGGVLSETTSGAVSCRWARRRASLAGRAEEAACPCKPLISRWLGWGSSTTSPRLRSPRRSRMASTCVGHSNHQRGFPWHGYYLFRRPQPRQAGLPVPKGFQGSGTPRRRPRARAWASSTPTPNSTSSESGQRRPRSQPRHVRAAAAERRCAGTRRGDHRRFS